MENNIPQGNTSMPVMPQMPPAPQMPATPQMPVAPEMPSAPMPAAPTSVVSQMPSAPKATEGGSGVKITIAVLAVVILGGLGWYFFTTINVIPAPVVPGPVTTRIPAKNLGPNSSAPTESSAPSANPAAGASATATASADMSDLGAIEGDMKNIDSNADVNTSDIQ